MGQIGQQSPRALLLADSEGPQSADHRNGSLDQAGRLHCPGSGTRANAGECLMFGRRSQRDFEDEIRSHLELETERLKAQGMSEADAARMARRHFGNVEAARERFYEGRRLVSLDDTLRDMRHALRALLRARGFLATSVGTLALAIGAVAGMFGVVNKVMLEPLPYANPEQLTYVLGTAPGSDMPERFDLGNEFYVHFKENSKLIDGIFVFQAGTSTFRAGERVERI